jgi:hypothetical protein
VSATACMLPAIQSHGGVCVRVACSPSHTGRRSLKERIRRIVRVLKDLREEHARLVHLYNSVPPDVQAFLDHTFRQLDSVEFAKDIPRENVAILPIDLEKKAVALSGETKPFISTKAWACWVLGKFASIHTTVFRKSLELKGMAGIIADMVPTSKTSDAELIKLASELTERLNTETGAGGAGRPLTPASADGGYVSSDDDEVPMVSSVAFALPAQPSQPALALPTGSPTMYLPY